MKKRFLMPIVALLAVVALAACSNNKQEKSQSTSTEKSSMTEKSSTSNSSSKTESSTNTSSSTNNTGSATFLTDEEMKAAKTVGDFKKLYANLAENMLKHIEELGKAVPEQGKDAYQKATDTLKSQVEEAQKNYNTGIAQLGGDEAEISEGNRQGIIETLKATMQYVQKQLDAAQKS